MSRLAVIGTGVIGNGWIARALAQGWDVVAFDPDPSAPTRTRAFIDNAWPSLTQLGLSPNASPERLTFVATIEEAVSGADLIQENVPERLPLKQETLAAIDAAATPDVIIGSSTSGFKPSDLQRNCRQAPGRVIVAHPSTRCIYYRWWSLWAANQPRPPRLPPPRNSIRPSPCGR